MLLCYFLRVNKSTWIFFFRGGNAVHLEPSATYELLCRYQILSE